MNFSKQTEKEIKEMEIKEIDSDEFPVKENYLKELRNYTSSILCLDHRGCRLGITMPEITRMQAPSNI